MESESVSAAGAYDMTKLIYLASPYSHEDRAVRNERFAMACIAAATMMRQGMMVYSPIAHTHSIAECGELPKGHQFSREFDERMIATCDELWVLMLPRWEKSDRVRRQVEYARSIGKPISLVLEPATLKVISYEDPFVRQVMGR